MAKPGYALGLQNVQLAATSSLQGLLSAPSLLDLHALCLPGAAGSQALPTHPPTQRRAAVPLRGSAQAASPLRLPVPPSAGPQRLFSDFLQLHLTGVVVLGEQGPGTLHRGVRAGVLCRGVVLPCLAVPACNSYPFPPAQAPGSVRALGFLRPVPIDAVKPTAGFSPTAKSIHLQTVKKKKGQMV